MKIDAKGAYNFPIKLASPIANGTIRTSIPLPYGLLFDINQSQFLADGKPIDCGAKVLANWPDNSIKWLHLSCALPEQTFEKLSLSIGQKSEAAPLSQTDTLSYESNEHQTTVSNAHYKFLINHVDGRFSISSSSGDSKPSSPITGQLRLRDALNETCTISSCNVSISHVPNLRNGDIYALSLSVQVNYAPSQSDTVLAISSNSLFRFTSEQEDIQLDVTLHNANAAVHSGGSWDLGDPNSFLFSEFSLVLHAAEHSSYGSELSYQLEKSGPWRAPTELPMSITQHSSGGENWQSPVHVDHKQSIPFDINGYTVEQNAEQTHSGERATPQIRWMNNINVAVADFWQKFPSSIVISAEQICLGLFPKQAKQQYELQGGEKSTHSIRLSTNSTANESKLFPDAHNVMPDVAQYASTDLPLYTEFQNAQSQLQSLINNGLYSQNNFFAKREMLDEYGWRNFGDIYADHETAEHDDSSTFVSHYNNQYDPIYGFLRQFLLSNNQQWLTLADDLAKHVMDIDIYHTNQDKDEYNGGLFWHTDHYLQAFTSSHRSYSKHQGIGAYQDHAGGGGPGGQHCYSSGLTLYYLLTGNNSAKEAVFTLTKWITYVYEGGNTCLELLLALKNRHVPGLKNHFTGQYPLDRGTANYMNALLDSYVLTHDDTLLHKVEHIIQNTVHPNEDIALRNLENIEETWFYTVFLQSVVRYLDIKRANSELDHAFYFARDCLLHFAQWMLEHEYMYLDKPDILEYPNDTWTAQDLRKAHVLSAAYFYGNKTNTLFLQKAEYFEHEVTERLAQSETKTYTRIMVLLMQNDGPTSYFKHNALTAEFNERKLDWAAPAYSKGSNVTQLVKAFGKRVLALSISNEVNWLKKRLG